jgi:hypothetical protein
VSEIKKLTPPISRSNHSFQSRFAQLVDIAQKPRKVSFGHVRTYSSMRNASSNIRLNNLKSRKISQILRFFITLIESDTRD